MIRATLLLCATILVAAAPVAEAARPPAGTKYRGTTSQGRTIDLTVSKSGTGLQMYYRERFRCRGIRHRVFYSYFFRDRPTIAADGSYRYRKRYSGLRARDLPGAFSNTQRLSGRFSADLTRVRGRAFSRVFNKRFACRSGITFTASRVP